MLGISCACLFHWQADNVYIEADLTHTHACNYYKTTLPICQVQAESRVSWRIEQGCLEKAGFESKSNKNRLSRGEGGGWRAQVGAVAGAKARRKENKNCVWNYWGKSAQGKALCGSLKGTDVEKAACGQNRP